MESSRVAKDQKDNCEFKKEVASFAPPLFTRACASISASEVGADLHFDKPAFGTDNMELAGASLLPLPSAPLALTLKASMS